jgi:hypothetical protein
MKTSINEENLYYDEKVADPDPGYDAWIRDG